MESAGVDIQTVEPQRSPPPAAVPLSIYMLPGFWRGALATRAGLDDPANPQRHDQAVRDLAMLEAAAAQEQDIAATASYGRWLSQWRTN